ncbi:MAG: hypothetical protein Q9227_003823 [Pyrenula ochraceoflavens]
MPAKPGQKPKAFGGTEKHNFYMGEPFWVDPYYGQYGMTTSSKLYTGNTRFDPNSQSYNPQITPMKTIYNGQSYPINGDQPPTPPGSGGGGGGDVTMGNTPSNWGGYNSYYGNQQYYYSNNNDDDDLYNKKRSVHGGAGGKNGFDKVPRNATVEEREE